MGKRGDLMSLLHLFFYSLAAACGLRLWELLGARGHSLPCDQQLGAEDAAYPVLTLRSRGALVGVCETAHHLGSPFCSSPAGFFRHILQCTIAVSPRDL